jgi:hypothetical protein
MGHENQESRKRSHGSEYLTFPTKLAWQWLQGGSATTGRTSRYFLRAKVLDLTTMFGGDSRARRSVWTAVLSRSQIYKGVGVPQAFRTGPTAAGAAADGFFCLFRL